MSNCELIIRMPVELRDKLRVAAATRGQSMAACLREYAEALTEHVAAPAPAAEPEPQPAAKEA